MTTQLDLPCDVQGRDSAGHLWAFLDEAARPEAVVVGHLVVTGDEDSPVLAKVLDIVERPGGRKVVMELVGAIEDAADALSRAQPTE